MSGLRSFQPLCWDKRRGMDQAVGADLGGSDSYFASFIVGQVRVRRTSLATL